MAPDRRGTLFRLGNDARVAASGVGVLVLLGAAVALPGTGPAIVAIGAFAMLAVGLLLAAARFEALRPFGAANLVTTIRLGLLSLLIGAVADASGAVATWWPVSLAGLALVLDGLDGAVARRLGTESRFGALFDQETDALLILTLTVLLVAGGKLGPWILFAGLMRYALLAASGVWPALTAPLPNSRFRSGVCAVMVTALVVCLLPPLTPLPAAIAAAIALTALTLSFGIDLIWLLKNARGISQS